MSDAKPGFVPVDEYLRLPREPDAWLVKSLIPVKGAALLYGQEKSGKSAIAIQLAAAISGGAREWMGFPIGLTGPVLYLQLDNPRSTWAMRFEALTKAGLSYTRNLFLADRESVEMFPFDILQPMHRDYLKVLVQMRKPVAVFVDTLREVSSGDENDSTVSRNVIANLADATEGAALIVVSHARKPQPDTDKDLMSDHRGSSYFTGRMDAIMRMAHNRLYFGGRSIEQGNMKLNRIVVNDETIMFEPVIEEASIIMNKLLQDAGFPTMREKARALAPLIKVTEEAAMSRLRRYHEGLELKAKPSVGVSSPSVGRGEVTTPLSFGPGRVESAVEPILELTD